MSAITQWVQDIVLSVVFNVMRLIAGMSVGATDIRGRLHLTRTQMADILGIPATTVDYHIRKVYEKISITTSGHIPCDHLTVYQAPVFYQSTSDTGRGGGTKQTKFYDLEILLMIAERMENNPRKDAILDEGRAIVAAYHNAGFVVNQQVARTDPSVMNKLYQLFAAPVWPSWRDNMRVVNNALLNAIMRCSDVWNADGTLNRALVNVTARLVHSNLYLAQFGMKAIDLFIERADPKLLNFNHITHRNPAFPAEWEFRNVTNLQHEDELGLRASKTQELIHTTDGLRRTGIDVATDLFLRCSVYLTRGKHNPYVVLPSGEVTDDIMAHRRTIKYKNPHGRTRNQAYIEAARIVEEYENNFFARKTWSVEEMAVRQHYYDVLQQELIENMDEMGELVINNNAANYPVDGTVSKPVPNSPSFDI